MKRKFKLITTFTILMFSISLMAFGVFAATTHSLKIENYISFDIEDNISFSIEGQRISPTGNFASRAEVTDSYYNQSSSEGGEPYEVGIADNDGKLEGWNISTPTVNLLAGESITWIFTIINKCSNPFYVNLVNITNPWDDNASVVADENLLIRTSGEPTIYVIAFNVDDSPTFESNSDTENISFDLKFTKDKLDIVSTPTYEKLSFKKVTDSTNGDYYEISAVDESVSGKVVIPNTYKPGDSALQTYSMSTFSNEELPVRKIANGAFNNNKNITKVDLSLCKNLTSIGDRAFNNCFNLTSVDLSNCENLTYIGTSTFFSCKNLVDINFTNCKSLTTFGKWTFYYCDNLTKFDFSDCSKLTTIGSSAITCDKIVQVKYNSKAPFFEAGSPTYLTLGMRNNPGLEIKDENTDFNGKLEIVEDYLYYTHNNLKYLMGFSEEGVFNKEIKNVASDITNIYQVAFKNANVINLDLSNCNKLTTIGNSAFSSCNKLVNIKYNSKAPLFTKTPTYSTFKALNNVDMEIVNESTEFTNKIEKIGNYIYYSTTSKYYLLGLSEQGKLLRKITGVSNNITDIYQYAFSYEDSISSIDLANCEKLVNIGASAFFSCKKLINFSCDYTKILSLGNYSFASCSLLQGKISETMFVNATIGENALNFSYSA